MAPIFNRRRFVANLGLVGGATFLSSLVESLLDEALAAAPEKKYFLMYMSGGAIDELIFRNFWDAKTSGLNLAAEPGFAFPAGFEAFNDPSVKGRVSFLRDLYNNSVRDLHGNEIGAATCAKKLSGNLPGGASFDHALAKHMKLTEAVPVIASGIPEGDKIQRRLASGPGRFVYAEKSPHNVFRRLYGSVGSVAQRRSALDLVLADVQRVRLRMASPERDKVDEYLDSLRSFEARLETLDANQKSSFPQCQSPEQHFMPAASLMGKAALVDAHLEVMARSFQCGMSRIGAFIAAPGGQHEGFDGVKGDQHTLHHYMRGQGQPPADSGIVPKDEIRKIYNFHATRIVNFWKTLQSIPTADGKNLAHHTIILWFSDNGGRHHDGYDNIPAFVIGDGGGKLSQGRYIKYPFRKRPMADLFVTLSHALGAPMTTFGDGTDPSSGPLSEIMA